LSKSRSKLPMTQKIMDNLVSCANSIPEGAHTWIVQAFCVNSHLRNPC
jgi:hypothetical protein